MPSKNKKLKKTKKKAPMIEMGGSGTVLFSGYITGEEYNNDLVGSSGRAVYDQMRRSDGQVQACLSAIELSIRQATWEIDAASSSDKDKKIRDFVQEALFKKMEDPWDILLPQVLLYLVYGFMMFEKVYKIEDGQIFLKKLAPRLPRTLHKWDMDTKGRLKNVIQHVKKGNGPYEYITIPASRIVMFVNRQEGDNFEGISILRSAYKHWYIKSQLEKLDAIRLDRWAVGTPEIKVPEGCDPNTEDYIRATEIAQNLRSHEQGWIVTPYGFEVGVLQPTAPGQGSVDILPSIHYHNEEIAKNTLTQFLTLGSTKAGARSLGNDFQNFFLMSIHAIVKYICRVMGNECIKPLVDYNYETENYPKLKASRIETANFSRLADAMTKLVGGRLLTPTRELEEHIREVGNLPDLTGESISEINPDLLAPMGTPAPVDKEQDENDPGGRDVKKPPKKKGTKASEKGCGCEDHWRELSDPEKTINLREMSTRLEKASERLINKITDFQDTQTGQLANDALRIKKLSNLTIKKKGLFASIVRGELLDIYRYGRKQVETEISKQIDSPIVPATEFKLTDHKLPPVSEEMAKEFIENKSDLIVNNIAGRLESTAAFAALEAKRAGMSSEAAEAFVISRIEEIKNAEAKRIASHSVFQAFSMGRNVEADIHRDEISFAYYSAIMDKNVCSPCGDKDGIEHEHADPVYQTPNPNCDGKDKCRCLTIYVMRGEA